MRIEYFDGKKWRLLKKNIMDLKVKVNKDLTVIFLRKGKTIRIESKDKELICNY